jgi:hypothetical protein
MRECAKVVKNWFGRKAGNWTVPSGEMLSTVSKEVRSNISHLTRR